VQRAGLAILAACCVLLAVAGRAAAAPPTLTAVKPTADGYTLVGTGFVAGKTALEVFEGAAKVAADRIVSVAPGSIVVRGKPTGTVQHKVVVGGQPTTVVAFTHDVPAPKLTRVERRGSDGYLLVGSGFGADRKVVEVFEGATKVGADRIKAVEDGRIQVASTPSGSVDHKVKVAGRESQVVTFDHKASASGARATQSGPRALTLARLQVTGYRAEAQAARALTLGTLSATGYREEAPQARSLTLGTLSAEGYRE